MPFDKGGAHIHHYGAQPFVNLFKLLRIEPLAVIAGEIDGIAVDDVKKASIPAAFVKLMKGRILEEPFTFFERCKHVEIVPDAPMTVQVDGELYDGLPFIADIVENKLRMWRGAPQTV